MHLDAEKEMMSQCVALLGKFIAVREPNIRYLGLVSTELLLWSKATLLVLKTFSFSFFFSFLFSNHIPLLKPVNIIICKLERMHMGLLRIYLLNGFFGVGKYDPHANGNGCARYH